jgi:hypothetical protein
MKKATLTKWQRDALETMHKLRNESDSKSLAAKQQANRVVALIDIINAFLHERV